jgi:uncharacterized phage protein (TIGR02218 family)
MKEIVPQLQAHLDTGTTTLCWCWRITRRDGTQLGFTDHDNALSFDGTDFEADSGLEAGEISESIGLSVDNLEVEGAVSSESLSSEDLADGLYDDAAVEVFRVNWQDPGQRVLMRAGSIGEVRRAGTAFAAEIRGLSHYLQQPQGRLFQYGCDTDLGSAKCGIDLTAPAYHTTATVEAVANPHRVRVSMPQTFAPDWFTRGLMRVTSGDAAGFAGEVRAHERDGSGDWLTLWQVPQVGISVGDQLELSAGCDKRFETCRDRFQNSANFRGFPHMPGNDFVTRYVRREKA